MLPTFLLEPSFMQQSACRTHSGRVYILPGCVQWGKMAEMRGKEEENQETSIGKSAAYCQQSFSEGTDLPATALINFLGHFIEFFVIFSLIVKYSKYPQKIYDVLKLQGVSKINFACCQNIYIYIFTACFQSKKTITYCILNFYMPLIKKKK